MSGTWSNRRTVIVIALATVAGFLFWLFGLFVLWGLLNSVGVRVDYWAMTEALSTAVTVAAVIGGGIIAFREVTEAASSRHVQVADALFSELNSQENIDARRWIYQNLSKIPAEGGLESLPPDDHKFVKQTLNSLDRVAFLTREGWIPQETIMPWMNPMVYKSWEFLGPWVDHESKIRDEPDYYEFARKLAEDCTKWREEHMPDAKIKYLVRPTDDKPAPG